MLDVGQFRHYGADPLPPLGVADQHAAARMGEPVAQLGIGPPAVERHDDRAETGRGEESDRPFGQVAHRQRDTVAAADAQPPQLVGECCGGAEPRLIADALVLIDDEGARTVGCARHPGEGGERGRLVLPGTRRHAPDRHRLHFEDFARRAQPCLDRGQRRHRPMRRQRDDRPRIRVALRRHSLSNPKHGLFAPSFFECIFLINSANKL